MSPEYALGGARLGTWRVPGITWTPGRITVLYLVLGFTALIVSDVVIVQLFDEPVLSSVQAVKGGAEVLATGAFIFVLTGRSRAQLQQTNDVLKRQREELGVLHRVLRHDLRNALTVINGTATHLRTVTEMEPDGKEYCERIERRAGRLSKLVDQASRIRRITENDDHSTTVDLESTVQAAIEDLDASEADVVVDVPSDARVTVNPLFEPAIQELVENAIRHADGGTPTVTVEGTVDNGTVTLTVTDDGPGIPPRVSGVFESGEFDQLLHLTGMGLWFAYWTIIDADGAFTISENDRGGTTVTLTIRRDQKAIGDVKTAAFG